MRLHMNKIKVMCLVDCILVIVGLFLVGINPFGRPAIGIIFIIISWIMVIITCFVWKSSFKRKYWRSVMVNLLLDLVNESEISSTIVREIKEKTKQLEENLKFESNRLTKLDGQQIKEITLEVLNK